MSQGSQGGWLANEPYAYGMLLLNLSEQFTPLEALEQIPNFYKSIISKCEKN